MDRAGETVAADDFALASIRVRSCSAATGNGYSATHGISTRTMRPQIRWLRNDEAAK